MKIPFLVLLLAAASAAFTIGFPKHLRKFDLDKNGQVQKTELQLAGVFYSFLAADKNGGGSITKKEFSKLHEAQHFDLYNSNNDKKLGLLEFLNYWCNEILDPSEEEIKEAFSKMDKDRNALVSEDEVRGSMAAVPEIAYLAGQSRPWLDKDGDGMLNIEEFAGSLKTAKYLTRASFCGSV